MYTFLMLCYLLTTVMTSSEGAVNVHNNYVTFILYVYLCAQILQYTKCKHYYANQ